MKIFKFNLDYTTRTVTTNGAILIPKSIRDDLGIKPGTCVELWRAGESSYLVNFILPNKCALCGGTDNLVKLNGKAICEECLAAANENNRNEE